MEREEAEWVVQRHGQTVYRLAYARTGNREDAEDVTQETFLRLVRAAPKFRDEDHCRAWLLRVAANCAQDLFRAPWRKRERPIEEAERVPAPGQVPEPGGVLEAVLSLPESYRLPVHLFYYEDYSVARIAEILHSREGTVKSQLNRGRQLLKTKLMEAWNDDE